MRPLELTLEGFISYSEQQHVCLRGLNLFAITGPTGSGKTSLIEAMVFALYGKVPRLPGQSNKDVISLGRDSASVRLVFSVGDQEYCVQRQIKTNGNTKVQLERRDGEQWVGDESGANRVNNKIRSLVGLDFDTFTRTVLLPQGQFQRFLAGKEERHKILRDLLGLDIYVKIMERANKQAEQLRRRIEQDKHRLETEYSDATPERELKLKQTCERLQQERESLDHQLKLLKDALGQARSIKQLRQSRDGLINEITSLEEKLEQSHRDVEAINQRVQKSEAEVARLRSEQERFPFDIERYTNLKAALVLRKHLDQLAQDIASAEEKIAAALSNQERAGLAIKAAQEKLDEAKVKEEEAEKQLRSDMARFLRAGLTAGDICPVCRRPIDELHDEGPSQLHLAEQELERARRAKEEAQNELNNAQVELGLARRSYKEAMRQREEKLQQHRELEEQLAQYLGEPPFPPASEIEKAFSQQEEFQRRLGELQEKERMLQDQLACDREELMRFQKDQLQIQVALEAKKSQLDETEKELERAAELFHRLLAAINWSAEPLDEAIEQCEDECRSLEQRLKEIDQEIGKTKEQLEQLGRDNKKAQQLRAELEGMEREAEVAEQLGHLLQADKLQAFAERQALQVLAEDGSRRLRMLSQGQYSLQADGRGFKVIDHWNADEARSVHTLSGGETFLASLALALGLAEHLPSLSTTPDASTLLESLFIDEGFGQLDQEALDLVASVLEQLSLERYLVGVVTHVEALAERLPAQIKVTKSVGGSHLTTVITSKERFALSGEAL